MIKKYLLILLLVISFNSLSAQVIKVNQIGYYPNADKIAIVPTSSATACKIVDEAGTVLQTFTLSASAAYSPSGETVKSCDFTSFTTPGRYKLVVDLVGESYFFDILPSVHLGVLKGSIRAYYYHRASSAITAAYGGMYTRASGHPDMNVQVHASAASATRPTGTVIQTPKGWYDAGDYNKYTVSSGISTFTILSAYEHHPVFYDSLKLNIPETGNGLPDILDEAIWNLDWMLSMQDPNDGGVYHKCTSLNFSGTVVPSADVAQRYVVMKSTAAALDFAAVMAVSSRIFKKFEAQKPGYSTQCLNAAIAAWNWAVANPGVYYNQTTNTALANVKTGEYGDNNVSDEFAWASAELFISTSNQTYLTSKSVLSTALNIPGWQAVTGLAWVSLGLHRDSLTLTQKQSVETKIINFANGLYNTYTGSPYKIANNNSFTWGSNGVIGNQGLMLLQAYEITADPKYLQAAMGNLDYLLGKNATGYCFITGYGSKSPMNIHHRISAADGIPGPIPGWLAGGPNSGREDGCSYPSILPALSYSETFCSYASNEVAINWNAAIVYLAGAIELSNSNKPQNPSILIQPSNKAALGNANVNFIVFAPGTGLMFQWQKDGVNIVGETNDTLAMAGVTVLNEGIYRVLVYNATDTIVSRNASFTLLVKGPYGGTRWAIPGTIQVEDYDEGGEGVSYHDSDPGNNGGAYRSDDVDIGGTSIGWTANNEWLNYSVNVAQTTTYQLELYVASPNAAGSTGNISILVDGVNVAANIIPPTTGNWGTFQTIYVYNIPLTIGDHELRLFINNGGFNIDYIKFSTPSGIVDKHGIGVSLFPNPSADYFTMTLDAVKSGASLILNSLDGKEVMNFRITETSFNFGENLKAGFYIGRIIEGDKVRVFEVVKF